MGIPSFLLPLDQTKARWI